VLGVLGYLFLPPIGQRPKDLVKQVPAAEQTIADRSAAAVIAKASPGDLTDSVPDASVGSAPAAHSVAPDASVGPTLAAAQDANAAGPDAGGAPLMSLVELAVEPAVEVSLDGRSLGRSPVQLSLPVGKHTVQLNDPERLIHVSRTITVGPKTKTSVHLALRTGFVKVTAPQGAQISIDNKSMGTAPLEEFSLFEGRHRIFVTLQSAKWQQAFSVKPDEHLSFNVETTPPR